MLCLHAGMHSGMHAHSYLLDPATPTRSCMHEFLLVRMPPILTTCKQPTPAASAGKWADHRGLLDFNVLSGDWPHALPAHAGTFPRHGSLACWIPRKCPQCLLLCMLSIPSIPACHAALPCPACLLTCSALPACLPACRRLSSFALLKEGAAWHDAASGLLLSFEAVGGCQGSGAGTSSSSSGGGGGGSPGLPLYNHSALNFFGFRGEWPGQEAFVRGDYTGMHSALLSACIVCMLARSLCVARLQPASC